MRYTKSGLFTSNSFNWSFLVEFCLDWRQLWPQKLKYSFLTQLLNYWTTKLLQRMTIELKKYLMLCFCRFFNSKPPSLTICVVLKAQQNFTQCYIMIRHIRLLRAVYYIFSLLDSRRENTVKIYAQSMMFNDNI